METFRARAEEWRPDFEIPGYIYAGLNGIRYDELDSRFPYALILPQSATEELLEKWADDTGAQIIHGASYVSHSEEQEQIVVSYEADSEAHTVRAQYLVAADGSRSRVRDDAGIAFDGRRTDMTGIVADADLQFPWPASMVMRHNEHGWVLAYPFGYKTTRFAFVTEKRRHEPKDAPVSIDELREGLVDLFGDDLGVVSASWTSRYGNAHRIVPELKRGRLLVLGEAARVHYPASGVGMNFCIQDAFNLGWKLGLVSTERADTTLLDSYNTERYPVAQQLMADVDAQVALQFDFSAAGRALKHFIEDELIPIKEVNELIRGRLSGCGTRYCAGTGANEAVGDRVADLTVSVGGQTTRVPTLLASATFVILSKDEMNLDLSAFPDVKVVEAQADHFNRLNKAHTILIRPDSYVGAAWTETPSSHDVAAALEIVLSQGLSPADPLPTVVGA
jgi:2-polyprenyl-6-methoxyphenol hydroxylase-like FAD-dependent oxidoreductase